MTIDKKTLENAADNIRVLIAAMVEKAKSGHPGGAMGGADFLNVLYSKYLVYDPEQPEWFARDRFFLDPGHMSPMLYSTLAMAGKFTVEELAEFRQWDSPTPGHPERHVSRGIENTSGPLGQGHTMAVGAAIAERFFVARFGETFAHKTYAFISDGGIQEEISQGAGRLAGYLGLNNLIMFYDSNKIQLSTETDAVTDEDTAAKYKAWGWSVIEINGNDADEICKALDTAIAEKEKPTLIIGHTVMGKGIVKADGSSFEGQCSTHGNPISASKGGDYAATIKHLGGDAENPFVIKEEAKKLYADRAEELRKICFERHEAEREWAAANPDRAQTLNDYIAEKLPEIGWDTIEQKPNDSTRSASAKVLGRLAEKVQNMIVSSADLANSDKTDAFLAKTTPIVRGDFSGAFLHAGVSELTMAVVMNGIAAHGGIFSACGTFFVFSDYMKPAVRMAALMELPVKYIWTHDAFRVGEDGPTHEPIEQEAQIRLMEQIKNFSGKPSMLVIRPADAVETTVAWEMAMENNDTPTALVLSRQNINDLPSADGNRYKDAQGARRGAYVVLDDPKPEVVLIANGSEVSLLCEVAVLLKAGEVPCRVVSAPSIGLFEEQPKEYRDSVLLPGVPRFGLTAGLPATLQTMVGSEGKIFGMQRFGASAPYKVLDEKFGFTAQNVLEQVLKFLGKA